MTIRTLQFSILIITLFSCGSGNNHHQESEEALEEQNIDGSTSKTFLNEEENDGSTEHLIIHGKDIWVRSEPATGEVVMKLNEGDKCSILSKGLFEIIRGDADYWYKIEFSGNQGWVFGSQTSVRNNQQIIAASSATKLFSKFIEENKIDYAKKNEVIPSEEGRYEFTTYEDNPNKFSVSWIGEGPSIFDYTLNAELYSALCFFTESASLEGAAGFTNKWSTYIGILNGDQYILNISEKSILDGKVKKVLKLNEIEFILFTFQDSGEGVVMFHNSYYNIYYINLAKQSVKQLNIKLGLVNRNGETYGTKDGFAIVSSDLEFKSNDYTFYLKEARSKFLETENVTEAYFAYDTLTTTFNWDAKSKTYSQ